MISIQNAPSMPGSRLIAALAAVLALAVAPAAARADAPASPGAPSVRVVSDAPGSRLQVDGRDFLIRGMNWDYIPIGQNYSYDFWGQPDDMIEAALGREMPLLKGMGVNAIRQYVGIPPRWVAYIYQRYGIFTVLNHTVGRYGYTMDGVWHPVVDYSDPHFREVVKADVVAEVQKFRGVPGVLMWLLGNENNYGLSWSSFEIEALPKGERDAARARYLYSLFGEVIGAVKAADPDRPVAIANGDLQYIDIIAKECKGLDVLGTNVYRGISVGGLFQEVKDKLGVPVMFSEFGCDAFNSKEMREDQVMQAHYLLGQWKEIYEQSSGKGKVGNAVGGFIFQWSDGWWKYMQDSRLDIHDTHASWPDGGYSDFVEGDNNMNEEWWGICAKGQPDDRGMFDLYPRAAYYALQQAFRLPAYAPTTDTTAIQAHFGAIDPAVSALAARGDHAALAATEQEKLRVSGLRIDLQTISTGATGTTTGLVPGPPSFTGFDKLQSYYVDFQAKPAEGVTGGLSLNVLGSIPLNPIDQIFYENRPNERLKVYRASVSWEERLFQLDGFYHTGHYHWGYEGDFFGLYREANYGTNTDVYNADAPVGFEIAGKKQLDGLKLAFGQELWWGANPAAMLKYRRNVGRFTATGIYQEDIARQSSVSSSNAVPLPRTRKATLDLVTSRGPLNIEMGAIWSGSNKIDQPFQIADSIPGGGYRLLQDSVFKSDAFGGKIKLSVQSGRWNWYAQAARMGLVAEGGPTSVITYTGWSLKDAGSGNQTNFMTGVAVNLGKFQVGPNFLWQKPIVGPIPAVFDSKLQGRNVQVLDDPFSVRANREMVGAEMMIVYDPTPATWTWAWDNDVREDAPLAASLDLVYRHLPTTQDAGTGILANGTPFAFRTAGPPRDLLEARLRLVSRIAGDRRLVATLFDGQGEPNGDSPRLVHRYGADARLSWGSMALAASAKWNDWGPYDYHRDFNLTFPVQLMGDLSHTLGMPRWFGVPQTRVGVRGTYRTLDRYSPRFCPTSSRDESGVLNCNITAIAPAHEWEVRTYLSLSM